ncbi:alpha-1-antitrypsin-like [Lissotriton helveticus]
MRSALYLCLFVTLLYGLVLCDHHEGHGNEDKHGHSDHKHHESETMACHKISDSISHFSFQLFNHSLRAAGSRNVVVSPVSVATTMAMLSLGAKGATLSQILHGLHLNLTSISLQDIHESFHHLLQMLNKPDSELQMSMGNALFIKTDFKILLKYLDDLKTHYNSEAFSTNFQNEEEAKKQINDYVEKHTNGKIVDMMQSVDKDAAMVLLNYIFFRGQWEMPFDVEDTKEDDFHVDEKTVVKVPMMSRLGMYSTVYDSDIGCTVVNMPYKGNASALLILPDEGKMKQVQDSFSRATLTNWGKSLKSSWGSARLYVPRFSISSTLDLKDILEGLGMTDMFSDHADLSGITEEANLKISQAIHKAVLSVDEKGTEAAAATVVEAIPMSLPPVFKANRPFLILIYGRETRSTLFMGKIADPTKN